MPQIESLLEAQTSLKEPSEMAVRTLDRAHANPGVFGGQVGQAMEGLGGEVGRLASLQQQDASRLANFQAQAAWQKFISQEQANLLTASRGVTNGGGSFTQAFMNGTTTDPATGATAAPVAPPDGAQPSNTTPPSFQQGNAQDAAVASVGGNDGGLNGRINKWMEANTANLSPSDQAKWKSQAEDFKGTMGLSALKQEFAARDTFYRSNIATGLTAFIEERLAYWKSAGLWNNPAATGGSAWGLNQTGEQHWNQFDQYYYLSYKSVDGQPSPQLAKWHASGVTNYTFSEGPLKGFSAGGAVRYIEKAVIGNPAIITGGVVTGLDLAHPYYASGRLALDAWVGYKTKIWHDKYDLSLQLNARDLDQSGGFRPILANSDGSHSVYRIVQPRTFYLSSTVEF